MTLSQSAGGSPATSPRSMVMSGWPSSCRVTSAENRSRSTASAPPAGSLWRSPAAMISEPARRISSCSRPTALVSASSERNELEQTSSASPSVLCASVCRTGRISCSTTGTPASRDLPGGLRPGESAADDMDGCVGHGSQHSRYRPSLNADQVRCRPGCCHPTHAYTASNFSGMARSTPQRRTGAIGDSRIAPIHPCDGADTLAIAPYARLFAHGGFGDGRGNSLSPASAYDSIL